MDALEALIGSAIIGSLSFLVGMNSRAYWDTMQDFTQGSYQNYRNFKEYEKDQLTRYNKTKEIIKIPGRYLAYKEIKKRDNKNKS